MQGRVTQVTRFFSPSYLDIFPGSLNGLPGRNGRKLGVTGKKADLLVFRDYLSGVLDYTQKRIKAGEPKDKIAALDNLPGFPTTICRSARRTVCRRISAWRTTS